MDGGNSGGGLRGDGGSGQRASSGLSTLARGDDATKTCEHSSYHVAHMDIRTVMSGHPECDNWRTSQ